VLALAYPKISFSPKTVPVFPVDQKWSNFKRVKIKLGLSHTKNIVFKEDTTFRWVIWKNSQSLEKNCQPEEHKS
jgi:hypothetical protein